jgi:DNA-binding NtrC family response regulator
MIGKILIVDDEKNLRESLAEAVEAEGFRAEQAADGAEALRKIGEDEFACILLDLRMPRVDGLRVLAMIREGELTDAPVIVISAFGESERTIEAMRLGAFDFLVKPLDIEEITRVLRRAVRQSEANRQRRRREKSSATADDRAPRLIGTSQRMREVFKQIGRVAATDATVLITGESGTGKEMIARAIHAHSARADQPFVAVNCGALPETLIEAELFGHERGAFTGAVTTRRGRFEAAQGGTLFLDEIGEMPPSAQVRLLRVLQERKIERIGSTTPIAVDVRVIAATHRNLRAETEAGRFREDLFYRLNVYEIQLPPLRERLADVPQLAEHFLDRAVRKNRLPSKMLSDDALRALMNMDFPGNVRELENLIERAAVASGTAPVILPEHVAPQKDVVSSGSLTELLELPFKEAVAALEKLLIERALRESDGNRSEAARRLGISRRLLYDKLAEHGIATDR